jgi:hypothetical protein
MNRQGRSGARFAELVGFVDIRGKVGEGGEW